MGITTEGEIEESYLVRCFIHNNTDVKKESWVDKGKFDSHPHTENVLLLARNLFELREYKKCHQVLK